MSIVRASVMVGGLKTALSSLALNDTGARMTVLDLELANIRWVLNIQAER